MRSVHWIKAADKDFRKFPKAAQETIHDALAIAAEGQKADTAKLDIDLVKERLKRLKEMLT